MTDTEIMNCMEVARIFLDYNDAKNEPLWYDEYDTHECRVGEVKEGASKAVIITDEYDYVVKVPFNGTTYYNDECIHCEKCARYAEYEEQMAIRKEEIQKKADRLGCAFWEASMDMPKIDDPCVGCDSYEYEEGHEKFTGAGIDYRNDYDVDFDEDDYCGSEAWLYAQACEWGVEQAFVEVEPLGMIGIHPIYAQKKVSFREPKVCSADSKQKFKSLYPTRYTIRDTLGGLLVEAYGEDFVAKLYKFIDFYHIGDLHNGNWTIIDGKPKIVDYGGYKETN